MPLARGSSESAKKTNFRELGSGKTFARTAAKSGRAAANRQRVAIVLRQAGESRGRPSERRAKR